MHTPRGNMFCTVLREVRIWHLVYYVRFVPFRAIPDSLYVQYYLGPWQNNGVPPTTIPDFGPHPCQHQGRFRNMCSHCMPLNAPPQYRHLTIGIAGYETELGQSLRLSLARLAEFFPGGIVLKMLSTVPHDLPTVWGELSSSEQWFLGPRVNVSQHPPDPADPGHAVNVKRLEEFAKGCDVVICCYDGNWESLVERQILLIDACDRMGAPRYIQSVYNVNDNTLGQTPMPRNSTPSNTIERITVHLALKHTVRGVTIDPGAWVDTFWNIELAFSNAYGRNPSWDMTLGGTIRRMRAINFGIVGKYIAIVALDPAAVGNQASEYCTSCSVLYSA